MLIRCDSCLLFSLYPKPAEISAPLPEKAYLFFIVVFFTAEYVAKLTVHKMI